MPKMSFDAWMAKVDAWLEAKVGLGSLDLADIAYWDLWEDGMSPAAAGKIALMENGW